MVLLQHYESNIRPLQSTLRLGAYEEACRQILTFNGDPSIRGISILLKTPLKDAPKDAASPVKRKGHGITRGAEQFREGGDLK